MPQDDYWVIEDTQTGLCCVYFSTSLPNCLWDVEDSAVQFPTQAGAETEAASMNAQAPAIARFIGRRPKPH